MSSSLFAVQSIAAAEAYVQANLGSETARMVPPPPPPSSSPGSFLHFQVDTFEIPTIEGPYRQHDFDFGVFENLGIPADTVRSLFDQAKTTGCRHSLFRYNSRFERESFEIRAGTPDSMQTMTLGGEIFCAAEEEFFGTRFVAHVHPPGTNPQPSMKDLIVISERARESPTRTFRHIVFGFRNGRPLASVLTSTYPRHEIISFENPSEGPEARSGTG